MRQLQKALTGQTSVRLRGRGLLATAGTAVRKRLAVALPILALILVVAPSSASAVAVPSNFWGIVPQATPTLEQFQRLKAGGVDSIRIPISWKAVRSPWKTARSTGPPAIL